MGVCILSGQLVMREVTSQLTGLKGQLICFSPVCLVPSLVSNGETGPMTFAKSGLVSLFRRFLNNLRYCCGIFSHAALLESLVYVGGGIRCL